MFDGRNLLELDDEQMREIRGRDISMIFQEPMTSLNPILTIGLQIIEPLQIHLGMTDEQARARAVELLGLVGIPDPERRLEQYPHQFSGGMRQRVMIAIGLACNPKLIIADEPTTALDVTIQAQILELMKDLSRKLNIALIIITHNLGVVARYADRVIVMYAARVVEQGSAEAVFHRPRHPYTHGPAALGAAARPAARRAGSKPSKACRRTWRPSPPGCRFAPRCPFRIRSATRSRRFIRPTPAALSRCHRHEEIAAGKLTWTAARRRMPRRCQGTAEPLLVGAQSDQAFPVSRRLCAARRRGARGRGRQLRSSIRARRWVSSANPAAARPPSAG